MYVIWQIVAIYPNPYKLIMVFGKKGSGKTTYLARETTRRCNRRYKGRMYSTCGIANTIHIDSRLLGKITLPENSLLLCDEIGIDYSNAQGIKGNGMSKDELEWWKYQRHSKVKVVVASQVFNDYLVQLRNLTDILYFMQDSKLLPGASVLIKINKDIMIDENTHDVVEGYKIAPFSRRYFFRSKYMHLFDSFVLPESKWIPHEVHYADKLKAYGYNEKHKRVIKMRRREEKQRLKTFEKFNKQLQNEGV